jgi:molybdopterin-guanine dinucleotide biosynthesis protein B
MKMFTVGGWSGSGKTTLITRLIKQFKSKNMKVIAVKSTPHKYYLEPETTDTFRFLDSGADEVVLAAAKQVMTMKSITAKEEVFDIIENRRGDCDILLMEGLRREGVPLIEVFDSTRNNSLKFPIDSLCAIVSDKPVTREIPNFSRDDIRIISRFLEAYHE